MNNEPRPYDLSSPGEVDRLLREVEGYLHTCRKDHHGTDFKGRMYAIDALAKLRAEHRVRLADLPIGRVMTMTNRTVLKR